MRPLALVCLTLLLACAAKASVAGGESPFGQVYIPPPPFVQSRLRGENAPRGLPAQFQITYINPVTATQQTAIEYAFNILATYYEITQPVRVQFNWTDLGGPPDAFFPLGQGAPIIFGFPGPHGPYASNIPVALANQLKKKYWSAIYPTSLPAYDIAATFNNNPAVNWYFGTDGNCPKTQNDFITVFLHEIHHGLGFAGDYVQNGPTTIFNANYMPYNSALFDAHLILKNGTTLAKIAVNNTQSSTLYKVLTTPGAVLYNTKSPYGNVRMYTPSPNFLQGTSLYHLDNATFAGGPNGLMAPFTFQGVAIHSAGGIAPRMLATLGWKLLPAAIQTPKPKSGTTKR